MYKGILSSMFGALTLTIFILWFSHIQAANAIEVFEQQPIGHVDSRYELDIDLSPEGGIDND